MTILEQIDRATSGICPCGAPPADGSAYCSDDCRPTHISSDTDTREAGHLATPMRWRPDFVTEADDSDLIPVDAPRTGYTGRFNATVFRRRTNPNLLHLRLDDGHRLVGLDVAEVADEHGHISFEAAERVLDTWRRLERELVNPRHTEPVSGDPWADVFASPELADAIAAGIPPMSREEAMARLREAYEQMRSRQVRIVRAGLEWRHLR
jgi:hypothetical protein